MSDPFTDDDITNMREAQEIHAYTDTAYYIPPKSLSILDEYGHPTSAVVETLIDCAFVDTVKKETWREMDLEEVDEEIYFSSIAPSKGGKFRMVSRFGQSVTARTFEIIGIQDRGAFGYVCALKAVAI